MAKIYTQWLGLAATTVALFAFSMTLLSVTCVESSAQETSIANDWQARLQTQLPLLGHRNWIVVADAAYPQQSAEGIETIYSGAGQVEVLETVLKAIDEAPHVFPVALLDKELASVPEEHAPGVEKYRKLLADKLKGQKVEVLPHEDIIAELDTASETFKVLLIKTDMTIPYTSVFLRLECGYWSAEKEKALRDAIANEE